MMITEIKFQIIPFSASVSILSRTQAFECHPQLLAINVLEIFVFIISVVYFARETLLLASMRTLKMLMKCINYSAAEKCV